MSVGAIRFLCEKMRFLTLLTTIHLGMWGNERKAVIEEKAAEIMKTGVKFKDACHVASAIYAGCEYFISTDKRLLKYQSGEIKMVTPIEFVGEMEEDWDDCKYD